MEKQITITLTVANWVGDRWLARHLQELRDKDMDHTDRKDLVDLIRMCRVKEEA